MDNKCLLNYHFRRFIDNNKLPIQFTLFYTSLKDFLVPLRTVGFQQTFLKGMIKSLKAVNCLIACKLIFCSENIVINSYKYYNSNLFMVPISIGMAIFNVTILTKLLKYSKNFLLPFVLSETIM
ncbi:hypothetical protein BmR1_04g05421 [Babesia microti strain RI]|uniref:Uncharacterized protein n=1 Tax=Babesia microti (strain RI) TaxID=1133968 RepID=A0A1N6LXE4_BABMR|nr:hypothetical protein BmR1_04g05421 [Babesia microti strain RI]SIO73549.1 hypothetical protein BmR1_04g05421 [Babesia microti strain RI]|eukprot:XP_021337638.1 hypothetical protein BmR1_04g05421 [Babesia microti strain RI]